MSYNLKYDNIFSKKSFNLFTYALWICLLSSAAFTFGIYHTRDFWRELYLAKGGSEQNSWDFELIPKQPFLEIFVFGFIIGYFI